LIEFGQDTQNLPAIPVTIPGAAYANLSR
jgi:hypothetical protein